MLEYGSEAWIVWKLDEQESLVFERIILPHIYDPKKRMWKLDESQMDWACWEDDWPGDSQKDYVRTAFLTKKYWKTETVVERRCKKWCKEFTCDRAGYRKLVITAGEDFDSLSTMGCYAAGEDSKWLVLKLIELLRKILPNT